MKIYIVMWEYDYFGESRSDVDCVFINEDKALQYVKRMNEISDDKYDIEEVNTRD